MTKFCIRGRHVVRIGFEKLDKVLTDMVCFIEHNETVMNCPSGYVLMKIIKMQKNQRKSKMLNEHLFYGGIFLCACSVGLAVILGSLYTIQKIRLNSKLNEEYGKEIKGK